VNKDISSCFFIILLVDVEGTRGGGIEVRPSVGEVIGRSRSAVNESSATNWGLGLRAVRQGESAENTHGSSQSDINDIITRSSSVGISGVISQNNTQAALVGLRGGGNGRVQTEIFNKASIRGKSKLID